MINLFTIYIFISSVLRPAALKIGLEIRRITVSSSVSRIIGSALAFDVNRVSIIRKMLKSNFMIVYSWSFIVCSLYTIF